MSDIFLSGHKIVVDVLRAVQVLSGNVFSGSESCVRELVANAADSLVNLTNKADAEIRLRADGETLEVSDNGTGMTASQVRELLGTIFATNKEREIGAIGRFGIGFYSCFPLCSAVEVMTRTRAIDDHGTRAVYGGGEELEVSEFAVDSPGTTVRLHVLKEHRKYLLDHDALCRIARRHCNFIPFPIYVGENWDIVNAMDAPWYRKANESELSRGLVELLGMREPLAVFPVHDRLGTSTGRVRGALFILPGDQQAKLRVYSHRVLVTDEGSMLIDDKLRSAVSGVLDIDDLPLVISRNAMVEHSPQVRLLRPLLIDHLRRGLEDLASTRPNSFRTVMAAHGPTIKKACLGHPALLHSLRDHFPYRSSFNRNVTVRQYLSNRTDRTVIYVDDFSVDSTLIPLYNRTNIEVVYMLDQSDYELRRGWTHEGLPVTFRRAQENPPADFGDSITSTSFEIPAHAREMLRELFHTSISPAIDVVLRPIGANSPPAILSLTEKDRDRLQFVEAVQAFKQLGRTTELPEGTRKLANEDMYNIAWMSTAQTVILNLSNTMIQQFISILIDDRSDSRFLPQIHDCTANFLYALALLSSGMNLSPNRKTAITNNLTELVACLLRESASRPNGAHDVV